MVFVPNLPATDVRTPSLFGKSTLDMIHGPKQRTKIRQKDIIGWSTGEAKPEEGERMHFLPKTA